MRQVDSWGRERWARKDALGRMAEVVEPDPAGNGSVSAANNMVTTYSYNTVDQLTQVNQGNQVRMFWYDSLGRLVRQKLAEQNGSLTYNGQFVGANNGGWSDVFVYDNRSNLIQRIDARGVKTNYIYNNDPLNRLQQVSYDKTGADTSKPIADASPLNISYMTSGDQTRVSQVQSWWTTETNTYDSEGRVSDYTIVFPAGAGQPLTTSYLYDTLSRVNEVRYPAQYGMTSNPRKIVTANFDVASRLNELKVDNQIQMNEIVYNPMSQVTQLKIGAGTGNADIEQYTYDAQNGLLTNQKVIKQNTSQTILDISYGYDRLWSSGTVNGKTGQVSSITNNLDGNKNRVYLYDALGRFVYMHGAPDWTQGYTYDRYGNRTSVTANGNTANNQPVPADGLASLSYDQTSNRINTSGYEYDLAGNLTRGQDEAGNWQRYEYDAAGRMNQVRDDAGNEKLGNGYTSSGRRLVKNEAGVGLFWYVWSGNSVLAEYQSSGWDQPISWVKSYIYGGDSLLSTYTKNGSSETLEFHHPDRLGTKLVTNHQANTSFEQSTLPFGTSLPAETSGTTNRQFTSYDRSSVTGLDYAVNRMYSSAQGRFTSVDPIGMSASSLSDPQSLNMYSYCGNDPINFTDPDGLFFGKLWNAIKSFIKKVIIAAVKAAITALVVFVISGGNVGAAAAAFVGDFIKNLAFPKMGNILTPSWNLGSNHPLSGSGGSVFNSVHVIKNFTSASQTRNLFSIFASVGAIANLFVDKSRPKAKFRMSRFRTCLIKMFNLSSNPFLPIGMNKQNFIGYYPSADGKRVDFVNILFDYSKNNAQLGANGIADLTESKVWIANDLDEVNDLATRVHEVGNKIADLYGSGVRVGFPILKKLSKGYQIVC